MKIVYLLSYFELVGGQEFFLARQQVKQGHEVYVIAGDLPYPIPGLKQRYEQDGLTDAQFDHRSGQQVFEGITIIRVHSFFHYQDFILVRGVRELLEKIKPDVVFGHEPRTMVPLIGAKYKNTLGYVYILDSHDFFHTVQNHVWWQRALRYVEYFWWRRWFVDYGYKHADLIISVADECRTFMIKQHHISSDRILDLPLGLETDYFHYNLESRKSLRRQHNIQDNEVVLLFAGYMFRCKALESLLMTVSALHDLPMRLVFAGDGPSEYLAELKNLADEQGITNKVIFAGVGGREQMIAWYSAADIGAWPGNNSLVIMEAMACRLPIIMADMQLAHLVQDDNGIKVAYGDQQELQEAVQKLSLDPALRQAMGEVGERIVREKYSYSAAAKKVTQTMKRLVAEKKSEG